MVVVLGFSLILVERGTKADLEDRAEQKTGQLRSLQRQLQSKNQGIDGLQSQINEIQQQREASAQAFQLVSGNNIDWYTALNGLFGAESLEVVYQSVSATLDGQVLLGGQALGEGALARLPSQLNAISDDLDFQSIQSDPSGDPPTFTATFQVRQ